MWICNFHTIDLYEDEIIQLYTLDAGVELGDDLADRSCFASPRDTGYVDAGAGAGGDGGFEVLVDGGEFLCAAWKRCGDGGDVQG